MSQTLREIAGEDRKLVHRGLERWTNQLTGRQQARENVALRALCLLANDPPGENAASPSPEFMGLFEDIAETATSGELADLLARILAGELRRPKSVSRRTLQIAAVLDSDIVSALVLVRSNLLTPNWLHIPPSKSVEWREPMRLLESVSITTMAGPRVCVDAGKTTSIVQFRDQGVVLTTKPNAFSWMVDGANLSPIGMELVSVLPLLQDVTAEQIGSGFKEHSFVSKVQIGTITERDNVVGLSDLKEI